MNGSVLFEGNPILSGSLNVNTGGNIEPLEVEINENGTREITPPSGVDGYAPITIETNVPQIVPVLETLNVTQNGRYEPPEGVAGYNDVVVNVPERVPVIQQLDYPITENGTYNVAKPENVDGFYPVNISVNVPEPVLISKTITQNGTYTPPSGVDGYDEINVNVQPQTPVFVECGKNLELIDSNGINQGWKQFDIPLSDSHRYLILLYMQNQGGSPFGYILQPNFAQYPDMEIYMQLQYSQFKLNLQSSRVNAGSSHNAGVKVTFLQIPDDYIASPF